MSGEVDAPPARPVVRHFPEPDSVEVGVRLRELRMGRRLTLRQVAERAGISEGFLSQIELGRSAPSLKTFHRLAQALGLEAADILDNREISLPQLVPREGGQAVSIGSLSKYRVTPRVVSSMEVLRGVFEVDGTAGDEPYTHGESDEVLLVLEGTILASVNGDDYRLAPGDTLCYRSDMPHTFRNVGEGSAEVVWIITPPSY